MVCYSPIRIYKTREKNISTGNSIWSFNPKNNYIDTDAYYVPCGRCEGCRLDHSFMWSVRCTCESYFHKESYFLTLTYDREHLPEDGLLRRSHMQSFIKRLRKHFSGYKLRVFYCGEYGEKRHRPHYHAIIFGLPLEELGYKLIPISRSKKGNINYANSKITKLWSHGLCTIGSFTPSSASYVAQYTIKKQKIFDSCYSRKLLSSRSSLLRSRKCSSYCLYDKGREFIGMSTRPSIGLSFFRKYYLDIFSKGGFYHNTGKKNIFVTPCRYFVKKLKELYPYLYWKFCERPARFVRLKEIWFKYNHYEEFAKKLDKKLKNRYIKEKKTLRRIQSRLDL